MLKYQLPDGRFHDILDTEDTFIDGTSAMMMTAAIYRCICLGYFSVKYRENADRAFRTVTESIDTYGLLRHVCGCPDFVSEGTSAEAQAAYIMASAWKARLSDLWSWNLPSFLPEVRNPLYQSLWSSEILLLHHLPDCQRQNLLRRLLQYGRFGILLDSDFAGFLRLLMSVCLLFAVHTSIWFITFPMLSWKTRSAFPSEVILYSPSNTDNHSITDSRGKPVARV